MKKDNWTEFFDEYEKYCKQNSESIKTGVNFLDNLFKDGIPKERITILRGECRKSLLPEFIKLWNSNPENNIMYLDVENWDGKME